MKYYISDLHLFHKNVTSEGNNFDKRPFKTLNEMHETIINNWNNKITNADTVYILGDLCWKENNDAISIVSQLKGRKVLVLGNHDRVKDYRYRQLFEDIVPYLEVDDNIKGINIKVILSHFPILFWNHQHRGSIHLYGHVHNSMDEKLYQDALKVANDYYKQRDKEMYKEFYAYNVGCMNWNYTPVSLEEIISANRLVDIR